MAGQKPYKPNDPPTQPHFKLPKETDAMPDAPKHSTHEQLRQQQAQRPNQAPTPQSGQAPSQSGGNLQNILAYFASQGVQDDHVVATIGGFPLKLSELKRSDRTQGQYNPPPPQDTKQDERKPEERKRPSKSEENDS